MIFKILNYTFFQPNFRVNCSNLEIPRPKHTTQPTLIPRPKHTTHPTLIPRPKHTTQPTLTKRTNTHRHVPIVQKKFTNISAPTSFLDVEIFNRKHIPVYNNYSYPITVFLCACSIYAYYASHSYVHN